MSEQAVREATEALWNYINSLPEDLKAKAIIFQKGLEEEAARTEGGMIVVLSSRVQHGAMLLQESLDELLEIASGEIAQATVAKARKNS